MTLIPLTLDFASHASTAGHWREKCDFARACNPRIGAHVALIDRATDYVRIFECIGIALTPVGEPRHQITDRRDAIGRIDIFFGLADTLTHPGEITNLQRRRPSVIRFLDIPKLLRVRLQVLLRHSPSRRVLGAFLIAVESLHALSRDAIK